jgi:hypothetical protein
VADFDNRRLIIVVAGGQQPRSGEFLHQGGSLVRIAPGRGQVGQRHPAAAGVLVALAELHQL